MMLMLLPLVMLEMMKMVKRMMMIRRMISTDEDSGDWVELHLVLPEVEQQVQETAVVRRQEGELQQVMWVKLQLGVNLWAQL